MAHKTIYTIIKGKVQGVFFRDHTRKEAIHIGLTGWVRNRSDGSVEALFSGDAEAIEQIISWLHQGSPLSRVDSVLTEERTTQENFSTFEIRY